MKIDLKLRDLNNVKMAFFSVLSIKLEPFSGYNSSVDMFTLRINLKNFI